MSWIIKKTSLLLAKDYLSVRYSRRAISFRKIKHIYQSYWLPINPKPPYDHICQIGDPVLRNTADLVNPQEIKSKEIQMIITKMRKALRGYDAVGIAAPQIGVPLRMFAVEFPESRKKEFKKEVYELREMSTFPLKIFINPVIKVLDYTKVNFPEGCESVKGFSALVPRYIAINVSGLNENGDNVEWNCRGWAARICQHEMEHLDGKMYIDSMVKGSLEFPLWQKVNYRSGRITLTFSPHN